MIDVSSKEFWESVEVKSEWVNYTDNVPVDIVVKDATPKEVEICIAIWDSNMTGKFLGNDRLLNSATQTIYALGHAVGN